MKYGLTGDKAQRKVMKAWLILIPLLFAVLACGDTGGRDAQGVAIGDESQVLARRHLESGLALHASGNFLDAIPEYDLALRIYPHYAEAYLNRGWPTPDRTNPKGRYKILSKL